jgi:G3E family GTPase
VIETSGLADPALILQTLMTDTSIAGRVVLGGVVTTVDTMTGATTLEREDISQKQVAVADRIVLTKLDLNGPGQPALLRRLTELNAGAPVLSADRGKIDSQCLFGAGLYDPRVRSLDVNSWLAEDRRSHARHHADIQTYTVVRKEPIGAITLTLFLETLAEHCGPVFAVRGQSCPYACCASSIDERSLQGDLVRVGARQTTVWQPSRPTTRCGQGLWFSP